MVNPAGQYDPSTALSERNIYCGLFVYTTYTLVAFSAIASVVFFALAVGDPRQNRSERQISCLLSITCAVPPFATFVYHCCKRRPIEDPTSAYPGLLV